MALAGDHHVGGGQPAAQVDQVGHQLETGHQAGPEGGQPSGQPPGRSGAGQGVHVDAEVAPVAVRQGVEPRPRARPPGPGRHPSAARRPRPPDGTGCATSQATTSSVGPSRWRVPMTWTAPHPPSVVAEPPTATTTRRAPASTAASTSSPTPAVDATTGSSPEGRGSSARPAACAISTTAVDPAGTVGGRPHSPLGHHRPAERSGHRGMADLAAHRVQGALAPVGHGHLVGRPPERGGGPGGRPGHFGSGRRAAELVGRGDQVRHGHQHAPAGRGWAPGTVRASKVRWRGSSIITDSTGGAVADATPM